MCAMSNFSPAVPPESAARRSTRFGHAVRADGPATLDRSIDRLPRRRWDDAVARMSFASPTRRPSSAAPGPPV